MLPPIPLVTRALLGLAAAAGAGTPAYRVAPAPAWVTPVEWDRSHPPSSEGSDGLELLLADTQIRAAPGEVARFLHGARRVVSAAGVENGSELSIDFEPSYERLVLHAVTVERGSRRLDALAAADVRVLQRETELERRLYDGRLTVHLILKGVRVGDVVEWAFTVRGTNPIFGRRYADREALAYDVPADRLLVRLLVPASSPLRFAVHGADLPPRVSRLGEEVEYLWDRSGVDAAGGEGDLPAGVDESPWVQLSEWRDWGEVARWAASIAPPAETSPAMAAELRRWRALPGPEARALAALRFVQDEVRYLGIEMGAHSHLPRAPAETFERRYGDCKDKSLLLVAFLRALGIEADTALVSTEAGAAVERRLPSPLEFDHVVVRARVEGRAYWLDPTRSLERGRLAARPPPEHGRALLVRDDAGGLERLPDPAASPVQVLTSFSVPRFGRPAALKVTTRLGGHQATSLRRTLADTPRADLARRYLDFYARAFPSIRPAGPIEVSEDEGSGEVVMTERYELAPVSAGEERSFQAESIAAALEEPETVLRRLPLGVSYPLDLRETIRIELPGPPDLEPDHRRFESAAAVFTRDATVQGNAFVAEFRLLGRRPSLEPPEVPAHVSAIRQMRAHAGFSVPLAVRSAQAARPGPAPLLFAALLGCGAVLYAAALWLGGGGAKELARRARRRAFARKMAAPPGEAPATAIRVRSTREMVRHAARRRCACGARLAAAGSPEQVRFDGREVEVLRLRCDRCEGGLPLYFVVGP
ncbi:MAG TPA: DUF3857 domain-containing protein [Anaeromyxobacteraceae bacterium]|nr:DUF3857 domain-containing protein [Anaeromyxobacteraceae bacterium]